MNFLVLSFILSVSSYANAYEHVKVNTDSLEKYCETSEAKVKEFESSMEHNGRVQITKRTRNKRARYKNYRGCHMDTPLIKQSYEALCLSKDPSLLDKIQVPKMILWHFTGAAFFNARPATESYSPVNIKGYEGRELIIGSSQGIEQLDTVFLRNPALLNRKEVEFHYQAGSGMHSKENYESAIACAVQTKDNLDFINSYRAIPVNPKWVITGFSNGATTAVTFQNYLPELGISIDHAILIDPVAKVHKYLFDGKNEFISERHPDTKYMEVYYQKYDRKSLPGLKLRGKPIVGADINIEIPKESFGKDHEGNDLSDYGHIQIYITKEVKMGFRNLVDKFLN